MHHFFRHPYDSYMPVKYFWNPVRIVEAILCLVCLALAIVVIIKYPKLNVAFKVLIAVSSAAFLVITIADLISNAILTPIYWNTWTFFAITAAIVFFICVGSLATNTSDQPIMIVAIIMNTLTAIIFLIDALIILAKLKKRNKEIIPQVKKKKTKDPLSKNYPDFPCLTDTTPVIGPFGRACGGPTCPATRKKTVSPSSAGCAETCPSRSKTVIGKPSSKIQTKTDGSPCLCDGTNLEQVKLGDGTTVYVGPDDTMYNTDGTPVDVDLPSKEQKKIVIHKDLYGRPILPNGTPLRQMETPCGTVLYELNGLLYNGEGNLIVPKVRKDVKKSRSLSGLLRKSKNRTYLPDGTPLTEIKTPSGTQLYEGPDGELYTEEGMRVPQHSSSQKSKHKQKSNRVCPCAGDIEKSTEEISFQRECSPRCRKRDMEHVRSSTHRSRGSNMSASERGSVDDGIRSPPSSPRHKSRMGCHGPCAAEYSTPRSGCQASCAPDYTQSRASIDSSARTVAISTRMVPKAQKPTSAPPNLGTCPCNPCEPNKRNSSTRTHPFDCRCPQCYRPSIQFSAPELSERLGTISEGEVESDSSGEREIENHYSLSSTATPHIIDQSSSHVGGTTSAMAQVSKKSMGSDEAQTSETRILKSTDVQKMNQLLPGAANNRHSP